MALGLIALTTPTYLYLKSDFLGWSLAKGGEVFFLGLFMVALIFTLINFLSQSQRRRRLALKSSLVLVLLAAGSLVPWINSPPFWAPTKSGLSQQQAPWNSQELQGRVAHAAGAINGVPYTNSLDALNENSTFYEVFEIDLLRTSDGQTVCVHDWPNFWKAVGEDFFHAPTLEEFIEKRNTMNFQPCDIESLMSWLEENPSKKLILDSKSTDHILMYEQINETFPNLVSKI